MPNTQWQRGYEEGLHQVHLELDPEIDALKAEVARIFDELREEAIKAGIHHVVQAAGLQARIEALERVRDAAERVRWFHFKETAGECKVPECPECRLSETLVADALDKGGQCAS